MTVFGRTVPGRRWLPLAALAVIAAVLIVAPAGGATEPAAAGGATATASKVKRVTIKGFAFKPKTLRITRGTRVAFKNLDRVTHTATRRGSFDTGRLRKGQSKTIRFKKRGTFRYICTIHPFMRGKIVVK